MSSDVPLSRESAQRRGVSLDAGRLQQLYERYAPDAAPVSVLHLREVPNGYNNKTFEARVQTRAGDEQHVAVRLSGSTTWASTKALEEASALDFVREVTSIPVPRVRFAAAADADLHSDWSFVVMDWMSGQELTPEIWRRYSAVEKDALVEELSRVLLELRRVRFDWCGRVLSAASPYTAQLLGIEAPTEVKSCGAAVVVPRDYSEPATTVGPFPSVYHSLYATLDEKTQKLLDHRDRYRRLDELLAFKDAVREILEELKPDLLRVPIVLVHGDFAGRNILVADPGACGPVCAEPDRQSYRVLQAVLDWEWMQSNGIHYESTGLDDFDADLKAAVLAAISGHEKQSDELRLATEHVQNIIDQFVTWSLGQLLDGQGPTELDLSSAVDRWITEALPELTALLERSTSSHRERQKSSEPSYC